jgi:hypothetical protein
MEDAFRVRPAACELLPDPHFHEPVGHRLAGPVQQLPLDSERGLIAGRVMAILERERKT